ncbi:hypothetical protein [Arcobacter roscoffensis]|uniref:Peptidase n=1 Tax=Arcobacter roscoffensis TaxID=2961520 RepID=A0ABY5E0R2_9BACT|nr:hypothetical protein [Arcobacter roscoffensis]UTJ05789.1 hypothetical protein NJU99_11095 [Arcobacter roscoffensis]
MLTIKQIKFTNDGKRIEYDYEYSKNISKYFNSTDNFFVEFQSDISSTPEGLAVIPFLGNLVTISWFIGFDIKLDILDKEYYESLIKIKQVFINYFPEIKEKSSNLIVNKLVTTNYLTNKESMLFSGGVDAYTTYFRRNSKNIDLITIWGADVELSDSNQWNRVLSLNNNENILRNNDKCIIRSNMRTFYSHNVNFLHKNLGWWGSVQHGLGLNSLIAPLSFIKGYSKSFIASSYTADFQYAWGSTPDIDNNIKWGSTQIIHDGFELKRQNKVQVIVQSIKQLESNLNLRVCYSEINNFTNCSMCEKCHRTIIGIILENDDPNKYGFKVTKNIYKEIINSYKEGFASEGAKYFWWEILNRIKDKEKIFIFKNEVEESNDLKELEDLLDLNMKKKPPNKSLLSKLKFFLINKYPNLFIKYSKFKKVIRK